MSYILLDGSGCVYVCKCVYIYACTYSYDYHSTIILECVCMSVLHFEVCICMLLFHLLNKHVRTYRCEEHIIEICFYITFKLKLFLHYILYLSFTFLNLLYIHLA